MHTAFVLKILLQQALHVWMMYLLLCPRVCWSALAFAEVMAAQCHDHALCLCHVVLGSFRCFDGGLVEPREDNTQHHGCSQNHAAASCCAASSWTWLLSLQLQFPVSHWPDVCRAQSAQHHPHQLVMMRLFLLIPMVMSAVKAKNPRHDQMPGELKQFSSFCSTRKACLYPHNELCCLCEQCQ